MNSIKNLAIIMDGNGRWAKRKGLKRTDGHARGAEVIRDITTYCSDNSEIETLTLYAFSTENWKRPKMEVNFLMKLMERYLKKELDTYMRKGVKFETIGSLEPFSKSLKKVIQKTKDATKNNTRLTQFLAINYGSQDEIVRAVNRLINENKEVTIDTLSSALDTSYKNVDLLIRTSGELRLSNYLLWQSAYAELFFTDTLWPDFNTEELEKIIKKYKNRERKFGGI